MPPGKEGGMAMPRAPVAAVLMLLACSIWWLIRGTAVLRGPPTSLICSADQECHITDITEWHLRGLFRDQICLPGGEAELALAQLRQRIQVRAASGATPTVVYIGPGDLNETLSQSFVQLVQEFSPNMILVEPNPLVMPSLLQQLEVLGVEPNRTLVIQAAACLFDESHALFHTMSDRLIEEFPHLKFLARNAALEKDVVVLGHLFQDGLAHGYSTDLWASMLAYIDETRVRCLSPSSLLREAGISARDVDAFLLNVGGEEAELLSSFLRLDGFAPTSVFFDWLSPQTAVDINRASSETSEILMERLYPVLNLLSSRGYMVYQCAQNLLGVLMI